MDFDNQTTYPERHHNLGLGMDAMGDFEDGEDFVALDSGASVVSSEWRNVSSSGSSSHVEDELTAKDIVSWHEFWDIWISHHPVIMTDIRDITPDYPFCQEVYSVIQFVYNIPRSRFNVHPMEQIQLSHELQTYLAQVTHVDAELLSEDASLHPQLSAVNGLAIAEVALEAHSAALRLIQQGDDRVPDDYWTTQVHDILAIKCAHGRLLRSSEAWSMHSPEQPRTESDLSPAAAMILNVRKLQPHGAIPVFLEDGAMASDQALSTNLGAPVFFAAAFSTRFQVASQLRDTDWTDALHCFSIMTTSTILAQMNMNGISLPVFGIMFDRNTVRFHVDWCITAHEKHISVPIHQIGRGDSSLPPFRNFDLTKPDDALRVAFILDAIHAYAQYRLTPAIRQRVSYPNHPKRFSFPRDEITSEEKVQAWMQNGVVAVEDIRDATA